MGSTNGSSSGSGMLVDAAMGGGGGGHHRHAHHNASSLPDIRQKFKQRFSILRHIALSKTEGTQHRHRHAATAKGDKGCPTDVFVTITEYQFGNSGNNLISMTNMLWLASVLNATLVLPAYMDTILRPFDLTTLHKAHCFVAAGKADTSAAAAAMTAFDPKAGHKVYEVESEDAFFMFKVPSSAVASPSLAATSRYSTPLAPPPLRAQLFNHTTYAPLLPPYTPALVGELSHHYLRVYAGFWCCPRPDIVAAAEYLIMNHLGGAGLTYSAVHKR
jgi:hypothetical protein